MAVTVTHAFTSAKADGPDATLVQPSDWNEAHTVTGALEYVGTPPTKTIGTGGDFTTITDALAWVNATQFSVGTLTFTMLDGVHTHDTNFSVRGVRPSLQFTAQNAPQVLAGTNFTAAQSGGSAGAYPYTLTVTDVTGVSVGDYVVINPTAGTNYQRMGGCFKVTGVNGGANQITILNTHRNTTFASGTITGTVLRPKAQIIAPTYTGAWVNVQNAAVVFTNVILAMQAASGTCYPIYAQAGSQVAFSGTAIGIYNTTTTGSCIIGRTLGYISFAGGTKVGISGSCGQGFDIAESAYVALGNDSAAGLIYIGGFTGYAFYAVTNSVIYQASSGSPTAAGVVINGSANSIFSDQRAYIRFNAVSNNAVTTTTSPTAAAVAGVYENV